MKAHFRVIAHRGASAHAPENTLPAFVLATAMGAFEIELDVRFSADEKIIVFHDDVLDHKTDRQGRVSHYDARTLKRTEIGDWFDRTHPERTGDYTGTRVTGLAEVFELLGDTVHYHIELKGFDDLLPIRLLQLVDEFELRERVTVTSFSMRPLRAIRAICPDIPVCFLLRDAHDALRSAEFRPELQGASAAAVHDYWIDEAANEGFSQVGVRADDVAPRTVARAADRGVEVRGWGVGCEDDLRHLIHIGAIGATVDWPARAIAIRDRLDRGER